MKILSTLSLCFIAVPLMATVNTGELRLKVVDSTGIGIKATVALSSEANQYFSEFTTDADGTAEIKPLPYGVYRLNVEKQGFSSISKTLEIRSAKIFGVVVRKSLSTVILPRESALIPTAERLSPSIFPARPTAYRSAPPEILFLLSRFATTVPSFCSSTLSTSSLRRMVTRL